MLKIEKDSGKLLRVPRLGLRTQSSGGGHDLRRMIAGNPQEFLAEINEKLFVIGTDIGRQGDGRPGQDGVRIDLLGVDLNGRSVAVLVEQEHKASSFVRALLCSEWLAAWGPQDFLERLNDEAIAELQQFLLGDVWQLNRDHRLIIIAEGHSNEVLWAAQNLRRQCRIDITLFSVTVAVDSHGAGQYLLLRREFPATGDGWGTLVRPQSEAGEAFELDRDALDLPIAHPPAEETASAEASPSGPGAAPTAALKQEALRTLASGLADYLGQAIAAVDGSAELALQGAPRDPAVRQRFAEIGRAVERIGKLSGELRTFAGRGTRSVERIDVARTAEQVLESLASLALPNVSVTTDFEPDAPPIEADPQQITRVLRSLVENAVEALSEQGGAISIRIRRITANREYLAACLAGESLPEGDYLYLEVADTGFGMNDALRERAFDPFFTTKTPGRGLGLSAVLGIVRNHRGALRVESQPGRGSVFGVCLPPAKSAERQAKGPSGPGIGNGRTVLIVEDQESLRALAAETFESNGFRVLAAADGWEALDIFAKSASTIDIVMLDWMMPDLDAEEAFRAIRRIRADTRIVVCGPFPKDEAERRFNGKKLAAYLEKPFSGDSLSACIRTLYEPERATSRAKTG